MISKSLVTIIMAARNVEEYIAMAIDSVVEQSYTHWELIVIENDSDDNTGAIIQRFVDPRIRLVSIDEPGLSSARNIGLDIANGEFICFLDADDRLPVNSISDRVAFFADHPEIAFVDGVVRTFSSDFSRMIRLWQPDFCGIPDREMALLVPRCFSGITWMIRKNTVGSIRFDTTWSHLEDRLYFLNISAKGRYAFVDRPIYDIRKRPGSLMTKLRKLEQAYAKFLRHVRKTELLDAATELSQQKAFHVMFLRTYLKHFHFFRAMVQCLYLIRMKLF